MKFTTASYLLGLSSVFLHSVNAELIELTQMSKKWKGKTQAEIQEWTNWSEVKFNEPYPKSSTVAYNHANNPNRKQCRNLDSWKVTHDGNGKVLKVYSSNSDLSNVENVWEAYPGVTSEVAIRCTATWDGDATFTYKGESAVLSEARSKAGGKGFAVADPQESFNFAKHCFGTWEVDECVNVEVTYEFAITNTYTIPQFVFYDKRENQNLQATVKNSTDGKTFNNYGSLLDDTHDYKIQPKKTKFIAPRVGGENSEKQTFTINTCDEGGMNFAALRIKMTLGIFQNSTGFVNHGNNGNLANRCGTSDSITFVKPAASETIPIITEIARPVINNIVNHVVEIYAPTITNISQNYYFVWLDGSNNRDYKILLNDLVPNEDGFFVLCEENKNIGDEFCTQKIKGLTFEGFSSFWVKECESVSNTTGAEECTKIVDTVDNVEIEGKIYRLHEVGDSDEPSGDKIKPEYWVSVNSTSPEILTPGTRDEFGLIITEVTDPSDSENKFIELYSPTGLTNQEIPPVLNLYLIINDGSEETQQALQLNNRPLDENGFLLITDSLNNLSGTSDVSIKQCAVGAGFDNCIVLDVYGDPKNDSTPDFTGGRAYRLQGPKHDEPKSIWDSNDWVIVKPLDGEDATPGNRDDFKLIITEVTDVTDPADEGNEFIELFSPTGHTNHPIKENLFLKRYDDGQSPATESLPLKGEKIDNKGFIVVCDADGSGCDLTDPVADLSGKDVVTIERCSDESGNTGCEIVDIFGIRGNAAGTPDFTGGRAYRLPGPVHDEPKSSWDSNDWVILGNVNEDGTTPGNRDDFKLIITEVTDPIDDENKFIELFSPHHVDESIPSNYRLVRYIDGKNDTPDIHNITSKELTNGYYIVPVSSTDDIKDLVGNDVVAIEKCVDNVCNVVDVYGIPNYGSDDDLKKHDFTDGRAYRLQGPVHDSPKQTWVKNDWVIVKPLKGNKTTRASRNDFELIITEVTDPEDDKKRFVELYSPSGHINYSIIENLYLKRYDGDGQFPSQSFELKDKFVNNNGFIVICASNEGGICQYTDDVADLNGGNTVTIEACSSADGTDCEIIDVFGIPGVKTDPQEEDSQDFSDGRAYRLQGPAHDTPKGTWERSDWVILKTLDGEDTTPGDRDDFNLIITEVTDADNFIELHSTNVHNNYPFPDNYYVVKYTGGSMSEPKPTVFPLKDKILDGNSFFVICADKSNESKSYCNANNVVGDLDGKDVVTIEKCVGNEYKSESCDIVDVYGIPGALSSNEHNFDNKRAYRKRGNVHDVAKSIYDSDDWVIAEIGNASTPGNRDDDNCPVANSCSDGEIGIWLSDDDFSCCKPNPLCGNVCEDTYCSCFVEDKNELGILNADGKCVEVKDGKLTGPSAAPTIAPGADTCKSPNQMCTEKCSEEACDHEVCLFVGKSSTGGECCKYASNSSLPLCPPLECIFNPDCPTKCIGEKCPVSPDEGSSPSSPGKGGKGAPPAKGGKGAPPAKGDKGVLPSKQTRRLRRVRK